MFSPTQMGQIYLIFNQLPFLWDTSDILSSIRYNERTPFASAEAGNIVGMHLSGITLKHIEGCTHIYKEFLPTNTNQNII